LATSLDCGNCTLIGGNQHRSGISIKASAAAGERKHLTHGRTNLRTKNSQ
jgi:hypothetical protein